MNAVMWKSICGCKERELVEAKRRFGDIGLRDATKTLHPLVQRVVRINDNLIEVQQNRLKLEATLAAVDRRWPEAPTCDSICLRLNR